MRDITAATQFIQEISILLDQGAIRSLEEVKKHIENKDVIDWLQREYPMEKAIVDFSMFQEKERALIHDALERTYGGYAGDERKTWGIERNGLCLLISWTTELIRDIYGRGRE